VSRVPSNGSIAARRASRSSRKWPVADPATGVELRGDGEIDYRERDRNAGAPIDHLVQKLLRAP
jgi:hypothetical protein